MKLHDATPKPPAPKPGMDPEDDFGRTLTTVGWLMALAASAFILWLRMAAGG